MPGLSQKDYSNYILPIGGVVLLYFFGDKILKSLGIIPDTTANNLLLNGNPFDPNFWTLKKPATLPGASVVQDAKNIYNSVHAFYANEPAVFLGVLQKMKTQASISYLSYTFQNLYGIGMIAYLSQYLTPAQLQAGANIAASKPPYVA